MSFAKPSTPTKNRSTVRQITPTKLKSNVTNFGSSSSINLSSSIKVLDEINLLLHLEVLKRNKDNESILKQKIEDAYRTFEERRYKYCHLVAKYATLVKLACTRKVLLRNDLIDFPTKLAGSDAISIKEKLCSGSATDYISTAELEKFKEMLHHMEKYTNLPIRRSELVDLQNATDAIQHSIEAIEISLEKCTIQGLDHFADILDMENYPKISKEHDHIEY